MAKDGVIGVVDDDDAVRRSVSRFLKQRYTVLEFYNAAGVLEHLAAGKELDLLVTDYAMPDMTGFELVDAIRNGGKRFPIIMRSASEKQAEAAKAGIPYQEKPGTMQELERMVEKALEVTE